MRVLLFSLCFLGPCSPLCPGAEESAVFFQRLSIEDGLSNSSIWGIMKDKKGFMWFSTSSGLNKYDGYKFTVYFHDPEDPNSLSKDWTTRMYMDPSGRLWIGSLAGANRFDTDTETFRAYHIAPEDQRGLPANLIFDLKGDDKGYIWLGTYQNGLFRLDPETEEKIHFKHDPNDPNSLSDNNIRSLKYDEQGVLWVGTLNGLNKLDPATGTFTVYRHNPADPQSISDNAVRAIHKDRHGQYWIGTEHGFNHFDSETGVFKRYLHTPNDTNSLSNNWINAIAEDRNGTLWLGTQGGGLNRFMPGSDSFRHFISDPDDPYRISGNSILSILPDEYGNIWVGTLSSGISKFSINRRMFKLYNQTRGLPLHLVGNQVTAIYEDSRKVLWVGTMSGLTAMEREESKVAHYSHEQGNPNSLVQDFVSFISPDTHGRLWIGSHNSGISVFDPITREVQRYIQAKGQPGDISSNFVCTILVDSKNRLWLSSKGGLDLYDPQSDRFTNVYGQETPGRPTEVLRIFEDSEGMLWLGTLGKGLVQFHPETHQSKTYNSGSQGENALVGSVVKAIYQEPSGIFWIGTLDGLNRFDPAAETFELVKISNSRRADGPIHAILGVRQGEIWISTSNGLVCLTETRPGEYQHRRYEASDGLQGSDFRDAAAFCSPSGELFFGGVQGLNAFEPNQITTGTVIPPIAITSFKVYNEPTKLELPDAPGGLPKIHLSHKIKSFTFEFAALDYALPRKSVYKYMLQGNGHSEWIDLGTTNFVPFSNLTPGNYVFWVKGTNNDGQWNEDGAKVAIFISPPVWRTPWFIGSVIFVLVMLVYWQLRVLRQYNEVLEEKVRNRTNSLQKANERLQETQRKLVETAHLAGMAEIAVNVLHNIGNSLSSVTVSVNLIQESVQGQGVSLLERIAGLLMKNKKIFEQLSQEEEKLKKVPQVLSRVSGRMVKTQANILEEINNLEGEVRRIRQIVSDQQNYANNNRLFETVDLNELIGELLTIRAGMIKAQGVEVRTEMSVLPPVDVEKTKLIQVMNNIINNALEALDNNPAEKQRILWVRTRRAGENKVEIDVQDSGSGIEPQHLVMIFQPNFTTKEESFGIGLHYCANAMAEMNGSIHVASEGKGSGALFRLSLSINKEDGEEAHDLLTSSTKLQQAL